MTTPVITAHGTLEKEMVMNSRAVLDIKCVPGKPGVQHETVP